MASVVERFLSADFAERLAMTTEGPSVAILREYLGGDALAEYQRLAAQFDSGHLAGNERPT